MKICDFEQRYHLYSKQKERNFYKWQDDHVMKRNRYIIFAGYGEGGNAVYKLCRKQIFSIARGYLGFISKSSWICKFYFQCCFLHPISTTRSQSLNLLSPESGYFFFFSLIWTGDQWEWITAFSSKSFSLSFLSHFDSRHRRRNLMGMWVVGCKAVPGGRNMLMEESGPQLMNDLNAFHVEWHTQGLGETSRKKRKILSC